MSDKKVSRQRRAKRVRMKIREQGVTRLCINRTPRHIYAQVIAAEGDRVLASASTLDKDLRSGSTGNVDAAAAVGKLVAERAVAAGIKGRTQTSKTPTTLGRFLCLSMVARKSGSAPTGTGARRLCLQRGLKTCKTQGVQF